MNLKIKKNVSCADYRFEMHCASMSFLVLLLDNHVHVCKMTEALSGVVKLVIGSRLPERRHNQQYSY